MPTRDIVILSVVFSTLVVPALGVTARFALKPIVDALLRLKEGGVLGAQTASVESAQSRAEVRQLRDEVARLSESLAEMKEAQDFHRALLDPPSDRAALSAGAEHAGQ